MDELKIYLKLNLNEIFFESNFYEKRRIKMALWEFLNENYQFIKALHFAAFVSWMAALFYMPRLFVYHTENKQNADFVRVVKVQERRLYRGIQIPAMVGSLVTGFAMIYAKFVIFPSTINSGKSSQSTANSATSGNLNLSLNSGANSSSNLGENLNSSLNSSSNSSEILNLGLNSSENLGLNSSANSSENLNSSSNSSEILNSSSNSGLNSSEILNSSENLGLNSGLNSSEIVNSSLDSSLNSGEILNSTLNSADLASGFEIALPSYMHLKLTAVVLLLVYHFAVAHYIKVLRDDKCTRSGVFFRAFNEIPTLLFLVIVFSFAFAGVL